MISSVLFKLYSFLKSPDSVASVPWISDISLAEVELEQSSRLPNVRILGLLNIARSK
jgi:hypothetical protein